MGGRRASAATFGYRSKGALLNGASSAWQNSKRITNPVANIMTYDFERVFFKLEEETTYVHIIQDFSRDSNDSPSRGMGRRWVDSLYGSNVGDMFAPSFLVLGVIAGFARDRSVYASWCKR